jgi:hypothetical protein
MRFQAVTYCAAMLILGGLFCTELHAQKTLLNVSYD